MGIENLKVEIYADGADIKGMVDMYHKGFIKGFTTNPTLMKKAGITSYTEFVKSVVKEIPDMPISFEVFADDFESMEREALVLAHYGRNVFVKIPIMNSKGESCVPLIKKLSEKGVNINVTAVFTVEQVRDVVDVLQENTKSIISVFAGRIADTGIDPETIVSKAVSLCHEKEGIKCLWASCREVFNIMQADRCGVDIITVTNNILEKMDSIDKNLEKFSLETVQMFANDGKSLGFSII